MARHEICQTWLQPVTTEFSYLKYKSTLYQSLDDTIAENIKLTACQSDWTPEVVRVGLAYFVRIVGDNNADSLHWGRTTKSLPVLKEHAQVSLLFQNFGRHGKLN